MTTHVIGELKVPSGRICAADPLTADFAQMGGAFCRQTPTGLFPVEVAEACFKSGDRRVACARVRFVPPDVRAVRWEVADFEGGAPWHSGSLPGYGVDTGTGSFFDDTAYALAPVDEATSEAWVEALNSQTDKSWCSYIAERGQANIVMFSSGSGDGIYTSYWGLDADGQLAELVTDFELLIGPLVDESFELPLPLPKGPVHHPLLVKHDVTMTLNKPFFGQPSLQVAGSGVARVSLSDGVPLHRTGGVGPRQYTWGKTLPPGTRLVVRLLAGDKPLDIL